MKRDKKLGIWILGMILILVLSGCGSSIVLPKDQSKMTPVEEAKVKEAAILYVKNNYQKNFVVEKVEKDRIAGDYYDIEGYIEDERKTKFSIIGNLPDKFEDSYVLYLWSDELEPHITKMISQFMDFRKMENLTYGYNDDVERKYKGDIPSAFEILKKGDKDLSLVTSFEIYEHGGQYKEEISKFLSELKKMNFNEVTTTIFVYDDQLKTASAKEDSGKHLLVRYNISGDIQTMDLSDLEKYKTQIK